MPVRMEVDAAAAPWPQTCDRANQRALAGARFSGHQQPFTGLYDDFRVPDHRGAIVERDRKILQAQDRLAFDFAALDATDAVTALGALKAVQRHHERGDAPRAG